MLQKQNYIPEPEEFMAETPLTPALKAIKAQRDEEIRNVISGRSDKLLVVVGPCSAHESAPTLEYISRLGKLNEQVKETVEGMIELDEITAIGLNSDYNFTNTANKQPRYQAVYNITHY